ncbi:MAG: discoidin domain-containing protein [Planctomycetia bacterium]|nr:discoidin domain-containing protein [Planctomycetia bacterium]
MLLIATGALAHGAEPAANLAYRKPTKASSEQAPNNVASKAVDGDRATRWCASGGEINEWWQVDLGKPEHVHSLRIQWEQPKVPYRYRVEASADGQSWHTIVDESKNKKVNRIAPHSVDSPDTRYLKVTFLGSNGGVWGSFWEFEAYAGPLPALPAGLGEPKIAAPPTKPADVEVASKDPVFKVTMFGVPPEVHYPTCLAAAPTGEVFVGVDEQGSLGKAANGGRILRCVDVDGDGRSDRQTVFCKVDHPRGICYDNNTLWVLHPPFLSVHHDDDGDGVADRHETLITGISTDQVGKRGADHTTNGIRRGIDGWIYIAVGDFGFNNARGTDGTVLCRRGGGIVRVRPDGTEMEIYAWGLRNIFDVCIDPLLNVFTRDNTNDGGGWNIRFSHILQSGEYGYPSLYVNFPREIMPTMADFGGGSGTGGLAMQDANWPEPLGNAIYTCDWGRSEVYRHNPTPVGATFAANQQLFLKIPQPTDIDVDGSGRMYVSSWQNGGFAYSGPKVGFVAQITPQGLVPKPFPDLHAAKDEQLVAWLAGPNAVLRMHTQLELLRRGPEASRNNAIVALAADASQPMYGRVAAIFAVKQLAGVASHPALLKLAEDASVREYALRALTDRKSQLTGLTPEPFVRALSDPNPRVRAQAIISLGRLGKPESAVAILPLTQRPTSSAWPTAKPLHAQPDPDRVIPLLAVRALVNLGAVDECVKALDGPHAEGAVAALQLMHTDAAVDGLVKQLGKSRDAAARQRLLVGLMRLYFREAEYKGEWWGTRPDNRGPYFNGQKWEQSARIASVLRAAVLDADPDVAKNLRSELARHRVPLDGLPMQSGLANANPAKSIVVSPPKVDPKDPNQIGNLPYEQAARRAAQAAGNSEQGRLLFTQQSCIACHTTADGQSPKGPHLVDIGKRYKRVELIESVLQPSAKIAQGFDTYVFTTNDGKSATGFVITESADTIRIGQPDGSAVELKTADLESRNRLAISIMPQGIVNNLTPEQLADLLAYLESLK